MAKGKGPASVNARTIEALRGQDLTYGVGKRDSTKHSRDMHNGLTKSKCQKWSERVKQDRKNVGKKDPRTNGTQKKAAANANLRKKNYWCYGEDYPWNMGKYNTGDKASKWGPEYDGKSDTHPWGGVRWAIRTQNRNELTKNHKAHAVPRIT